MNFILLSTLLLILQDQVHGRSLAGLNSYEVVYPRKVHSQYKRDTGRIHPDILQYKLTLGGKEMVMHLERTEDLTADNYTETFYLPNGDAVTSNIPVKDHCYYQGHIKQEDDSLVSISTCDGLSGYIKIGDQVYLIKPLQHKDSEEHAVYKQEDIEHVPKACGVANSGSRAHIMLESFQPENTEEVSETMKYVELYVVLDHSMYKKYNYSQQAVKKRLFQLVNHANLLYKPMNISLVLAGSEIWTIKDLVTFSQDIEMNLDIFSIWSFTELSMRETFDVAFLITNFDTAGPIAGLAFHSSMCLSNNSGGVIRDSSDDVTSVGETLAHEIGHTLGMNHDEYNCECRSGAFHCIMGSITFPDSVRTEFSSCSFSDYANFISTPASSCINNKPLDIATTSGYGNMILQDGEECDCGSPEECKDPSCNVETCTLKPDAKCSSGECCENCQFKSTGVVCRPAKDDCDLSEVCDGQSAQCPDDKYRLNGFPCKNNQGYCYMGKCPTLQDQCIDLMGPGVKSAAEKCFMLNTLINGYNYGYCKKEGDTIIPCAFEDMLCGTLFCEDRKFGQSCLPNKEDESQVSNGTKCGSERMCLNGECTRFDKEWKYCSEKCKDHAVCNHELQCQCEEGWAPPNCDVLLFPKAEP